MSDSENEKHIPIQDVLSTLSNDKVLKRHLNSINKRRGNQSITENSVKSAREERKAQYQFAKDDMTRKWLPQILHNDKQEQLVLIDSSTAKDQRINRDTTRALGSEKIEPRKDDDFEQEMHKAYIQAYGEKYDVADDSESDGGDGFDEAMMSTDGTTQNREHARQIARIRSLVLREQKRSKRVKKIKSKLWHRIQKRSDAREKDKLLERLEIENPELAKSVRTDIEKKLANIRLLRQRTARRKWGQLAKRFGGKEMRQQISKQNQLAHDEQRELERAIKGKTGDDGSDDDSSSEDENDGDEDNNNATTSKYISRAKRDAQLILGNAEDRAEINPEKKQTGLLGLRFMQEGFKKRREESKEEARQLLEDLDNLESEDEGKSNADKSDSDRENIDLPPKDVPVLPATKLLTDQELDKILDPETFEILEPEVVNEPKASSTEEVSPWIGRDELNFYNNDEENVIRSRPKNKKRKRKGKTEENDDVKTENITGQTTEPQTTEQQTTEQQTDSKPDKQETNQAGKQETNQDDKQETNQADKQETNQADKQENVFSNKELVRELFDNVNDGNVHGEEFEKEFVDKAEAKLMAAGAAEDGLVGWGSGWVGDGLQEQGKNAQKRREKREADLLAKKDKIVPSRVIKFSGNDVKYDLKYKAKSQPFDFHSKAHYERHIETPIGPEWQSLTTHSRMIQPKIVSRLGVVIPPLSKARSLTNPEDRDKVIDAFVNKRNKKQRTHARL